MIKCPNCKSQNCKSLETRQTESGRIRRRKECYSCGYKFTTYEVVMTDFEYLDGAKRYYAFLKGGMKHG